MSWGWRVPFLTGSLLGVVGILLRTQTKGLHQDEEGEGAVAEEALYLHAPELEEATSSSLVAVVGEGVSPAVLEADRTRDYRARHPHPQQGEGKQAQPPTTTFWGVVRAAAGADKLRVSFIGVGFSLGVVPYLTCTYKHVTTSSCRWCSWRRSTTPTSTSTSSGCVKRARFASPFSPIQTHPLTHPTYKPTSTSAQLGTYLAQLAPSPIPASEAFSVTCVAQVCFILTNPLWGALGDRFGGACLTWPGLALP
jgi:MFS family permease